MVGGSGSYVAVHDVDGLVAHCGMWSFGHGVSTDHTLPCLLRTDNFDRFWTLVPLISSASMFKRLKRDRKMGTLDSELGMIG